MVESKLLNQIENTSSVSVSAYVVPDPRQPDKCFIVIWHKVGIVSAVLGGLPTPTPAFVTSLLTAQTYT